MGNLIDRRMATHLGALLAGAALLLTAAEASAQTAPTSGPGAPAAPAVESSRAATGERPATSDTIPTDDTSRALWYRPGAGESRPSTAMLYKPLAVQYEPQVLLGAGGGTLGTLQINSPLAPGFGVVAGLQVADAARFIAGFDIARYSGFEIPIANGPLAFSAIIAPTFQPQAFVGNGAIGADVKVAPVGVRGVVTDGFRSMFEVRLAGHFYAGTDTTSSGTKNTLGTAGGVGLELTFAPLFIKNKVAIAEEHPKAAAKPAAPTDDEDEDAPKMKKKKKKREDDDDESTTFEPAAPTRAAISTWGGAS